MKEPQVTKVINETINKMSTLLSESSPSTSSTPSAMSLLQEVSEEIIESNQEKNFHDSLKSFKERIENGTFQLLKALGELTSLDKQLFSPTVATEISRLVSRAPILEKNYTEYKVLLSQGKTFQEIYSISNQTIEALCKAAAHLFENHFYKEASDAFCVLTFLSPKHAPLWVGYGHVEYMCGHYEAGMLAYALAINVNPHDPVAYLHLALCQHAIGEDANALSSLEKSLQLMGDNSFHSQLKKNAQDLKHKLEIPKSS